MKGHPCVERSTVNSTFWSGLWDRLTLHNGQAKWLREVRSELKSVKGQTDFGIYVVKVKRQSRKVLIWNAPGPDQVRVWAQVLR